MVFRSGKASDVLNFAEFGCRDRRNKSVTRPTHAWYTFYELAKEQRIEKRSLSGRALTSCERRIQQIRQRLRTFNPNHTEEPFLIESGDYTPRFKVKVSPIAQNEDGADQ